MKDLNIQEGEISKALSGDISSLEKILKFIQGPIFRLSLKFLWHPEEAEDATQEILIKITTNLNTFKAQSKFSTWVYSIASHHLLNIKKMRIKRRISFVRIENEIHSDTKVDFTKEIENREILSQVKVACTHALLQGLSKDYRIAFLLGEIFGLSSEDAANSLNIKSETYRKRLSRSREMMKEFLMKNCGLMQKNAPCSCNQRLKPCLEKGMIDPYLKIAERMISEGSFSELESKYRKTIDDTERLALIYKSSPDYEANEKVLNKILKLFNLEKESAH